MTETRVEFESMSPQAVLEFMRERSDSYHLCKFALETLRSKLRNDKSIQPEQEAQIQEIWSEAAGITGQARELNTGQ